MKLFVVSVVLISLSTLAQAQITVSTQTPADQTKADTAIVDSLVPQANVEPAKAADIHKLLELTGGMVLAKQMMERSLTNLRPLMTSALPPGDYREQLVTLFMAKFQSKITSQTLENLALPVYDKYFSREEIRGLIEFYQTPLGHKTVSVLPQAVAEVSDHARAWGTDLGRDSMKEVLAEHPDLAKALDQAKAAQK